MIVDRWPLLAATRSFAGASSALKEITIIIGSSAPKKYLRSQEIFVYMFIAKMIEKTTKKSIPSFFIHMQHPAKKPIIYNDLLEKSSRFSLRKITINMKIANKRSAH
jgi:hypothetical protein